MHRTPTHFHCCGNRKKHIWGLVCDFVSNLIIIKEYITKELDLHLKELKLEFKCMAITASGKKCTNKALCNSKVCKKHEKTKNVKLVQERKNYSCIVYHNHLPNEEGNNCPRCNLVK